MARNVEGPCQVNRSSLVHQLFYLLRNQQAHSSNRRDFGVATIVTAVLAIG